MTQTYYTRRTADYSPLLVHFTASRRMVREASIQPEHPLYPHRQNKAIDRLINILVTKTIYASPMPFVEDFSAVCFTECVWDSLMTHADRYSSYGVVFSKRTVFQAGGGPALYVRGDILQSQLSVLPDALKAFVVPFDPSAVLQPHVPQDWIHEREWRLPGPISFDYADVNYVLVESLGDAERVIQTVGTMNVPAHKFIPMETYRTIRNAWSPL